MARNASGTARVVLPAMPIFHSRRSLAHRQVLVTHTDLDDARLVHSGDTHVLEDLVVDLAPPWLLNHDFLAPIDQRPERRSLWLLCRIATEGEVYSGVR